MKKVSIITRQKSPRALVLPLFPRLIRLRFGSVRIYNTIRYEFNHIDAVKAAIDKLASKRIFEDNGVRTAEFSVAPSADLIPCLYKPRKLSQGRGIKFIDDVADLPSESNPNGFFERTIKIKREYRVHVIDGRCVHVDAKKRKNGYQTSRMKNKANGYKFLEPKIKIPMDVVLQGVNAVRALGLDFGAADVAFNGTHGYVLEVNTAMGLRTKTKAIYERELTRMINKRLDQ